MASRGQRKGSRKTHSEYETSDAPDEQYDEDYYEDNEQQPEDNDDDDEEYQSSSKKVGRGVTKLRSLRTGTQARGTLSLDRCAGAHRARSLLGQGRDKQAMRWPCRGAAWGGARRQRTAVGAELDWRLKPEK